MSILGTRDLKEHLKDIGEWRIDPFEEFRRNPLREVREACLRAMKRSAALDYNQLEAVQSDIRHLREAFDPLWEDYLSVYANLPVMAGEDDQVLRFIIDTCGWMKRGVANKILCARPLKMGFDAPSWAMVKRLENFFLEELDEVLDWIKRTGTYSESEWNRLHRVTKRLVRDKKLVAIPKLLAILRSMGWPKGKPRFISTPDNEDRLLLVQHRAFLKEAIRHLKHVGATRQAAEELTAAEGVEHQSPL